MTAAYLRRALLNPGIFVAVMVAFVLVVLAYQAEPTYNISIGTATDGPLLRNFYDPETPPNGSNAPYPTYRWSSGPASSITLRDIGRHNYDVTLSVNGSRPAGQPAPTLLVSTGSATLLNTKPPPGAQEFSFTVPAVQVESGTLTLDLVTNPFKAQGDPRNLGIILTSVKVSSSRSRDPVLPPPGPLAAITGSVALLSLLLAILGWGAGGIVLVGGSPGVLAALLLVFDRLWLTSAQWYWSWPLALVAGGALALVCQPIAGRIFAWGGVRWSPLQSRILIALILLVFAIRLAGQLHPSIFVFDLGFHVNILLRVLSGDWLFTTQPAEMAGFGHSTPYLPTPYIFMEPLDALLHDHRMAIRLMTVATGTLGALPVFYLAAVGETRITNREARLTTGARRRRDAEETQSVHVSRFTAQANEREEVNESAPCVAGILASFLYLTVPISVIIFSWGITPNIFGEYFALCALAVGVGGYRSLRPSKPAFWALVGLLTVTILSHPGVLALSSVAFLAITASWWLARRRLGGWKTAAGALGAYATAVVVSVAIYYQHFIPGMLDTLKEIEQERATGTAAGGVPLIVGGSVQDTRLGLIQRPVHNFGEWFFWGLEGFWNEARAYYRVWPIAGAVVGYSYVSSLSRAWGQRWGGRGRALVPAAIGWTIAVGLLALVGWATNLFVRYALFALPIISVGSGLLLSALWGRGRVGRWLALLVVVFFAVEALAFWQNRINFAFK